MYMEAGVANKVDRHAMVTTNKSKHKGITDTLTIVIDSKCKMQKLDKPAMLDNIRR